MLYLGLDPSIMIKPQSRVIDTALTVAQVAAILRVPSQQVEWMIYSHHLDVKHRKVKRKWRVLESEVARLLESQREMMADTSTECGFEWPEEESV